MNTDHCKIIESFRKLKYIQNLQFKFTHHLKIIEENSNVTKHNSM